MHTAQHISETESQLDEGQQTAQFAQNTQKNASKNRAYKHSNLLCWIVIALSVDLNFKNLFVKLCLKATKKKNAHNLFSMKIKKYSSISLESQKGIITFKWYPGENQKDVITMYKVWQKVIMPFWLSTGDTLFIKWVSWYSAKR